MGEGRRFRVTITGYYTHKAEDLGSDDGGVDWEAVLQMDRDALCDYPSDAFSTMDERDDFEVDVQFAGTEGDGSNQPAGVDEGETQ